MIKNDQQEEDLETGIPLVPRFNRPSTSTNTAPAPQTPQPQMPAQRVPARVPAAQMPARVPAAQMPAQMPARVPAAQMPARMPAQRMPAAQMPALAPAPAPFSSPSPPSPAPAPLNDDARSEATFETGIPSVPLFGKSKTAGTSSAAGTAAGSPFSAADTSSSDSRLTGIADHIPLVPRRSILGISLASADDKDAAGSAGDGSAPPPRRRFFSIRNVAGGAAGTVGPRRVIVIERSGYGVIICALLLLLAGGAFGIWHFLLRDDQPQLAVGTPVTQPLGNDSQRPPAKRGLTQKDLEEDVVLPPITDPPETDDTPRVWDLGKELDIPTCVDPEEKEPPPPPQKWVYKPRADPATDAKVHLVRKTIKHTEYIADAPKDAKATGNPNAKAVSTLAGKVHIPLSQTVDTMIVYTTELLERFGNNHRAMLAHIDHVMNYHNQRLADRNIKMRLRLVGLIESPWKGPTDGDTVKVALGTLMSNKVPTYRYNVHSLRKQCGADTVTFIFRFNKRGGGGLASVLGPWAAMNYPTGAIYSHEMRHNGGWNHGDKGNWTMIGKNARKMSSWQGRKVNTNQMFVQYMGRGDEFDPPPEEKATDNKK